MCRNGVVCADLQSSLVKFFKVRRVQNTPPQKINPGKELFRYGAAGSLLEAGGASTVSFKAAASLLSFFAPKALMRFRRQEVGRDDRC